MNTTIQQHFDAIEAYLIQCPVMTAYQLIRREIGPADGKIRIKINLLDDSLIECFEYVDENEDEIRLLKYSFYWQDANVSLLKRWDNAPHFLDLPNAPHHIHNPDGSVSPADNAPTIFTFLEMVEKTLRP